MPRFRLPASLLALFFLIAAAEPAGAQTSPAPPTQAAQSPALDLLLLKQALAPVAANGVLQSRSTIQMTGSKQGVSFTFREQAGIIAKRPGKFRADVTQLAADGTPQRRLVVISDGVKVWTFRPGMRQYTVTSAKTFHAANNDMTALGLAQGGFFLGDGHDMAKGLQAITKESSPQALQMLAGMGIGLTGRVMSVDGQDEFVYRMVLSRQGLSYQFFIDPATAALKRIELTGKQNGVSLEFWETVGELKVPATVAKTTFQFSPPTNAVKVASLSVDPF